MTEVYVIMAESRELFENDYFPVAVFNTIEEARHFCTVATAKSKRYRYVVEEAKMQPTEDYATWMASYYG